MAASTSAGSGRLHVVGNVRADARPVHAADRGMMRVSDHRHRQLQFGVGECCGIRRSEVRRRIVGGIETVGIDMMQVIDRGLGLVVDLAVGDPERRVIAAGIERVDDDAVFLVADDPCRTCRSPWCGAGRRWPRRPRSDCWRVRQRQLRVPLAQAARRRARRYGSSGGGCAGAGAAAVAGAGSGAGVAAAAAGAGAEGAAVGSGRRSRRGAGSGAGATCRGGRRRGCRCQRSAVYGEPVNLASPWL